MHGDERAVSFNSNERINSQNTARSCNSLFLCVKMNTRLKQSSLDASLMSKRLNSYLMSNDAGTCNKLHRVDSLEFSDWRMHQMGYLMSNDVSDATIIPATHHNTH